MTRTISIDLNGEQVKHDGEIAGRHGYTLDGQKIYVNFSPPFWNANAFTMTETVLEQVHDDCDLIAFRDKAHDLHVYDAAAWTDDDHDAERFTLQPGEMGSEDAVQVAVKLWDSDALFEGQGKEFNLDGGKHTAAGNVA